MTLCWNRIVAYIFIPCSSGKVAPSQKLTSQHRNGGKLLTSKWTFLCLLHGCMIFQAPRTTLSYLTLQWHSQSRFISLSASWSLTNNVCLNCSALSLASLHHAHPASAFDRKIQHHILLIKVHICNSFPQKTKSSCWISSGIPDKCAYSREANFVDSVMWGIHW